MLAAEDGQEITVCRRLRSRPEGTFTAGGNSLDLGNGALRQLTFLPREIFIEVYALTVDQLRFPDAGAWERLQDRLLGGQYASFLRPVRDVVDELEGEAKNFWRPDRRGNPRAKQLQESIRAWKQKRREAEENEKALRRIEARLVEINGKLEELWREKTNIAVYLNRSQRLYPALKNAG